RKIVLPRLAEFVASHPQVELEISTTDRRVDLVREGFDCVLRVGELPDTSLVARRLGSFGMVNCASPAYLRRYGTPVTLDDLAAHRLIHYVSVFGARSIGFEYVANGRLRQVPMTGSVTVNNTDTYEAACLGGLGLIQAPWAGVRDYLESGQLCAVLGDYLPPPMEVSVLYAHRRYLPQRVRVFMQWLEGLLDAQART
ncbi:LysR family transcriptional regulator, partial [Pseudomonas sp. CrR25]|nr:LysR family transcriptional regulator [Pseudomonas sp. CrR25]